MKVTARQKQMNGHLTLLRFYFLGKTSGEVSDSCTLFENNYSVITNNESENVFLYFIKHMREWP